MGINTVAAAAVYRCVKGGKEHQVMLACTILTMTEKGYNSIGCQQKEKKRGKGKKLQHKRLPQHYGSCIRLPRSMRYSCVCYNFKFLGGY